MNSDRAVLGRSWTGDEAWDELVEATDLHLAGRWLRAVEASRQNRPAYVIRQGSDGAFRGAAVGYIINPAASNGHPDSLSQFTRADRLLAGAIEQSAEAEAVLARLMPNLLCGGWTLTNSNLALSRALGPRERREVIYSLIQGVAEAAHEVGARSVCFPYVEERNGELRGALRELGFLEFPAAAHYALDVIWPSFEEYTGVRRSIRRELAILENAGITFRVAPLEPDVARAVAPLAVGTVAKHQGATTIQYMLDRLLMMAQFGGQIILAEHDGVIRGFGVILEWRDQLYARMVGFDYEFQRTLPLYFGIMYEQVRYAIGRGLKKIEYAIAGDRAKMLRGAEAFPQFGYLRIADSADSARVAAWLQAVNKAK